ncbi:hypothetical protein Sango_2096300 [Sesamum angolense]|uniref:RNase H type-1 domain-containing protein n=1 Tax=Sesamum angolense TaxID=2727404 RepID=A0AAE1WBM8_9LAMI|nr:hypothetical protein Sango_2096300 [Sesamum angolense]
MEREAVVSWCEVYRDISNSGGYPVLTATHWGGVGVPDGPSTLTANGVGVVLTCPEGDELEYALHINFKASNNEAKYEALIASIKIAFAYSDSRLVTKSGRGMKQIGATPLGQPHKGILPADEMEEACLKSWAAKFALLETMIVNFKIEGFEIGVPSRASNNASRSLPILNLTQVEVTDRILVQGIKTKLEQASGQWGDALLGVLWL